jgi:hypothetical protein
MGYKIFPECRACLERLVNLAVQLATPDPSLREQAREQALAIIAEDFHPDAISAIIANRFHRAIQEITANQDPFFSRKQVETAKLSSLFHCIAPSYTNDLESLLKLAVVGNAIDFFRDETEVDRDIQSPVAFTVHHLEQFREMLANPGGFILYLADNAGEQFFDAPLVSHLRRSGRRVLYVVKPEPIQNDLTRADLVASGLVEALEPVIDTGARTVGLVLSEASPDFRALYDAADIIIAKGMGHFETMDQLGDPRLFFLLQAKCGPVARAWSVAQGSFIFGQAGKLPLDN